MNTKAMLTYHIHLSFIIIFSQLSNMSFDLLIRCLRTLKYSENLHNLGQSPIRLHSSP